MIFLIIGFFIIIYGFNNVKKGFFLFLIYKIFLVTNINIVSLPGLPLFSLDLFMTMFFTFLIYMRKDHLIMDRVPFPYTFPFKWLVVSWFISTVFAYIGFVGAFSQFVKFLFLRIITPLLLWKMITDKQDIVFLVKWITFAFLVTCIYGFYEHSILANPLIEYESSLVIDDERAVNFLYDADFERGYRVQSVFEHAIGAGINWAMFIILILTLSLKYKFQFNYKMYFLFITILLCLACLIFTNSRAPLVFLGIGCFSFINLKNKKVYKYAIIALIVGLILLPYFSDYADTLLSIFDSEAQAKVGGSNAEMRIEQLDAAVTVMMQSPIFGLGFKFMNVMDNNLTQALLGMESMWFSILTQFGLLGVVANLIYAYYSLIKVPKLFHSKSVFFISLAYWITASLTSVPGMLMYFYYLIIIIFIKLKPDYEVIKN